MAPPLPDGVWVPGAPSSAGSTLRSRLALGWKFHRCPRPKPWHLHHVTCKGVETAMERRLLSLPGHLVAPASLQGPRERQEGGQETQPEQIPPAIASCQRLWHLEKLEKTGKVTPPSPPSLRSNQPCRTLIFFPRETCVRFLSFRL